MNHALVNAVAEDKSAMLLQYQKQIKEAQERLEKERASMQQRYLSLKLDTANQLEAISAHVVDSRSGLVDLSEIGSHFALHYARPDVRNTLVCRKMKMFCPLQHVEVCIRSRHVATRRSTSAITVLLL